VHDWGSTTPRPRNLSTSIQEVLERLRTGEQDVLRSGGVRPDYDAAIKTLNKA